MAILEKPVVGLNGLTTDVLDDPVEHEPVPSLDMENLSWRMSKDFTRLGGQITQAQKSGQFDQLDGLFMEVQALMALVVLDVPAEWLVKNAPKNLDWSKAESFDWIKSRRVEQLMGIIGQGGRNQGN